MIWAVVQMSCRRLKNNRSELLLTFVVPILFFSIFAIIFGSRGGAASGTPRIKVAIADASESQIAQRATALLGEQQSLRITDRRSAHSEANDKAEVEVATVSLKTAEDLVRRGVVSAAIVFDRSSDPSMPEIRIMSDSFDQVASQVVSALVQRAVMTSMIETHRITEGARSVVHASGAGGGTRLQSASYAANGLGSNGSGRGGSGEGHGVDDTTMQPPAIAIVDVLGGKKTNPVVAMYAAGIAVMFLLFSATTASGSLLEERENSTLDRLLTSRLTMDQLLLGKWAYLTMIGILQMTLMFGWGSLVFGIELVRHWEGFLAMTLVTAGAAASFALFLASMCRTRMQLGWVSTIIILTMSALGGSMVPRYLMSETVQRAGLVTFNAWALEGYNKVFWRELGLRDIEWELGVLTACALAFILTARFFAMRWERS